MRLCVALLAVILPWQAVAQQTIKLSATLTLEKTDDKQKTFEAIQDLQKYSTEKKMPGNVERFIKNAVEQMKKVMEVQKVVDAKAQETPKTFTSGKYKVKDMPKLRAKKMTVKKMTVKDLKQKLQSGSGLNFKEPYLVTNASSLFQDGSWDAVRRMMNSNQIIADEETDPVLKDFKVEYFPPDKARARLVGNMLQMEEPQMIPFSRYMTICFLGTPAKPTLPGQNTEHCEQVVNAQTMRNASALDMLNIFPEVKNTFPLQDEFRKALLDAGSAELPAILGKDSKKWISKQGRSQYRFFTFGPSGSGDKLHAENSLPFFDVLVHGSRRWLLLGEKELERVAVKAREALEFDKTSAYMFFEEKLPELIEEFGLKKYVETNQDPGDLMIVPSGWYRVSLALSDSISFYETILADKNIFAQVVDNNIWRPNFRQFQLAYCFKPEDVDSLPGVKENNQLSSWLKDAVGKVKMEEAIWGILTVLMQCGSVLALDKPLPHLGVTNGLTSCSTTVWDACRARLEEKLKDKGVTASLDWIPKSAPRSVKDVPAASSKKEEL